MASKAKPRRQSLEQYLAERATRDEDTPEKVEWLRNGVAKRRMEMFGWRYAE